MVILLGIVPAATAGRVWEVSTSAELDTANAQAAAGDIIYVADGTYTTGPAPADSGLAGNRITYIGNLNDPSQVQVTTTAPTAYITVKGFEVAAGVVFQYTHDDSLYAVICDGSLKIDHVSNSVFSGVQGLGVQFAIGYESSYAGHPWKNSNADTISDCHLPNLDGAGGAWGWTTGNNHSLVARRQRVSNCIFRTNRLTMAVRDSSCYQCPRTIKHFNTLGCTFYGNRLDITDTHTTEGNEADWIVWRDSCNTNIFRRDTIIVSSALTARGVVPFVSSNGNQVAGNHNVVVDSCFWKTTRLNAVYMNDEMSGLRMTSTQLLSREDVPFEVVNAGFGSDVVLRHNTLYSQKNRNVITYGASSSVTWSLVAVGGVLFYSAQADSDCGYGAMQVINPWQEFGDSCLYYRTAADSTRAIYLNSTTCGAPPGHSRWFDPAFEDTTWESIDLRPWSGSMATAAGFWPDNYAGALTGTPCTISDLACDPEQGKQTAGLSWTWPCNGGGSATYTGVLPVPEATDYGRIPRSPEDPACGRASSRMSRSSPSCASRRPRA